MYVQPFQCITALPHESILVPGTINTRTLQLTPLKPPGEWRYMYVRASVAHVTGWPSVAHTVLSRLALEIGVVSSY